MGDPVFMSSNDVGLMLDRANGERDELATTVKRLRESIAITDRNYRALQTERDALKQRVDDQALAMTTALEWLESLGDDVRMLAMVGNARAVLAKALRKEGE